MSRGTRRDLGFEPRTRLASGCVALTVAYALSMTLGWAGFRLATFVYVLLAGLILTRSRLRSLPAVVLMAVAMGFGVHYVFTRIFVIDLP